MATQRELQQYLGALTSILWNYGAAFPVPYLERYQAGELGFSFTASLPGLAVPRPAEIRLAEIWQPTTPSGYRRVECAYDFIEYPPNRRRAFHGHDPDYFMREFGVLVHEHCEDQLGAPACSHYYGLPIDGYQAIDAFARVWGQPTPLGCAKLRCLG